MLVVKNLPTNAGDVRDLGLIPGSGRSPRGGHGNPLEYSCLENPTHRGAWWAAVRAVAKCQTRLKQLSMHVCICIKWQFYLFPSNLDTFSFSCLIFSTMLNRSDENWHPCLAPDFRRKAFGFSPLLFSYIYWDDHVTFLC